MIARSVIFLVLVIAAAGAWAADGNARLFESDAVLDLTLAVDFDTLCKPSEDPDCDYSFATLSVTDANGAAQSIPIDIRRRDGWRASNTNCQVPTLFVRFHDETAAGTPFEGQTTLALTSHCGKGVSPERDRSRALPDEFETYVLDEYLGYRLYSLVTDISLRVRLVRITYADPENPRRNFTRYAFFAEHFNSLAQRLDAELLAENMFDPERLDLSAADRLALFQYMIGNTDWSIAEQNNIILLRTAGQADVPVLFDLDMSGLVNAFYAMPADDLPIRTVKQRYYMGFCHPGTDWDVLFTQFNELRENIMTALAETPGLGRGDRRSSGAFLDSFYKTIGSLKTRNERIVEACQPLPSSA